ncbi:MAG TPA: GNAT family N-acetyltransferase [Gammaproteobacteria bacterium]|nr:GNAT family N-acetyltransferase [Gammaproteobacteria bacterium]
MKHDEGLTLRPPRTADAAFMEGLFRSTREHFYYSMPAPREHVDLLIAQQYRLQQAHYARQWPAARTLIIERSGMPIGKITLDEGETALHIVDFIIEPAARGQGYGTAMLQALQTTAKARRITLSVDRQNLPAKRLYLALGFRVDAVSETHEAMSWVTPAFPDKIAGGIFHKQNDIERHRRSDDHG